MSTYTQAKAILDLGRGKGSYRVRLDGTKIHLAYLSRNRDEGEYMGYCFAKGKSENLILQDLEANDWVIE